MHQTTVVLQARLAGIAQSPRQAVPLPSVPPPAAVPAPPALLDASALREFASTWARLLQDFDARLGQARGELAQRSVELGVAVAERLIGAEIAADRQRLERIVLAALERMPTARFVIVRGHPEDLALLTRLCADHADLQRYRDLMTFRPEETLQRGQLKLEADEWFVDWDTHRCLAELRGAARRNLRG